MNKSERRCCDSTAALGHEQSVRNTLGDPMTFTSVEHLLKNRRYIGEFKYRDVVIPDGIPAIVPKELFDSVQDRMEKNKKAPSRHKAEDDYLLTRSCTADTAARSCAVSAAPAAAG